MYECSIAVYTYSRYAYCKHYLYALLFENPHECSTTYTFELSVCNTSIKTRILYGFSVYVNTYMKRVTAIPVFNPQYMYRRVLHF